MTDRNTRLHHSPKMYPDLEEEFKKPTQTTSTTYNSSTYGYSATRQSPSLRKRLQNEEDISEVEDSEEDDVSQKDKPLPREEKSGTNWTNINSAIFAFLIVLAIIAASCMFVSPKRTPPGPLQAEELYDLEKQFPTQSQNLWTTIVSGIKNLYSSDPTQPCILLLLLNEDNVSDTSLQQETGECIARLVAKKVVNHMGSQSGPAVVDASTVTATDYGDTLQFLTRKISAQKALVITNLQELSGSLAQSLHVICDRYNPMVRDALVVFTLKSKQRGKDENVGTFVTRTLTKLWEKDVPADKLPALITRVAGSIVSVTTEKYLPNDCV